VERIQCEATKHILNDYESSYKSRLEQLHLLPLMYTYELNGVMFLVKCLKQPSDNLKIHHHITFATSSTRFGNSNKLVHPKSSSSAQQHFCFNRIVKLWNHLPLIDMSLSIHQLKLYFTRFLFGENSQPSLLLIHLVLCTLFILVIVIQLFQCLSIMSHLTQLTLINNTNYLLMHTPQVCNFALTISK